MRSSSLYLRTDNYQRLEIKTCFTIFLQAEKYNFATELQNVIKQ